jgi:hypothetical protein
MFLLPGHDFIPYDVSFFGWGKLEKTKEKIVYKLYFNRESQKKKMFIVSSPGLHSSSLHFIPANDGVTDSRVSL